MSEALGRAWVARRLVTMVRSAFVVGTGLLVLQPSAAFAQADEPPEPAAVDLDEEPAAGGAELDVKLDSESSSASSSSEGPKSSDESRPSPLDVMPGIRLYSRAFRYTGTLEQVAPGAFDPMVDYNLDVGPMPFVNLHWYPFAHFMGGVPAHIGITGGYEMGIATKVQYAGVDAAGELDERTLNQSHSLWYAGLRARIPISFITIGIESKFGNHSFALKDSSDLPPLFPSVSYTFIEEGLDVEAQFGSMLVGAQASYLYLLSAGDLVSEEWFASAKGKGVHVSGHVGWAASKAVHLLAGIDARAYGFNFNPVSTEVADNRVAGGATDRYLSFWLGVRLRIPEKGGASSAGDSGGGRDNSDSGGDDFDSFD